MRKIIHHIRRQPEETRRHILHVLTICFAIALLLLWIYSLGTNLANPDTQAKINNDLKPFAALKDGLVGGYKSMSETQ
ncbi:MAG: hypothetical protein AAB933_02065 [Patescibacteria group bacterium]